ncbi:MAG: aminoglycoside phosphotransferase family protein [Cytophagaceae bacterium]|nr:MAG: aminoglycoside phosphotransferase family protein [Cytophagaceae bacterium]
MITVPPEKNFVLKQNDPSEVNEIAIDAPESCGKVTDLDTFDAVKIATHHEPKNPAQVQGLIAPPAVNNQRRQAFLDSAMPAVPSASGLASEIFPLAKDIHVNELQGSHSGNVITRLDVDGQAYVLKSVAPARTHATLTLMQKEIRLAIWASGASDLGPQVRAHDEIRGFFVADFVDAQYTQWDDASCEPKRSAILGALYKLHALTRLEQNRPVGNAPDVAATNSEMARLSSQDRGGPRLRAVRQTIETLAACLSNMSYQPVTCHGDVHGGNALYTAEKLHLIDWEQSYVGDGMEELASLADQLGVKFAELPKLALDYKTDNAQDILRLQLYYTIRLARRVVQGFVVMPWNADKVRDEVIDAADARLQDALKALGIETEG